MKNAPPNIVHAWIADVAPNFWIGNARGIGAYIEHFSNPYKIHPFDMLKAFVYNEEEWNGTAENLPIEFSQGIKHFILNFKDLHC